MKNTLRYLGLAFLILYFCVPVGMTLAAMANYDPGHFYVTPGSGFAFWGGFIVGLPLLIISQICFHFAKKKQP